MPHIDINKNNNNDVKVYEEKHKSVVKSNFFRFDQPFSASEHSRKERSKSDHIDGCWNDQDRQEDESSRVENGTDSGALDALLSPVFKDFFVQTNKQNNTMMDIASERKMSDKIPESQSDNISQSSCGSSTIISIRKV